MKRKTYIIALLVFSVGVLMLIGSSYSLIIGNLVSSETYGFDVANFDVQFSDNKQISISGIPETDEEGFKNSKEFSFTISNNSDYDVNYRLDILENNGLNMGSVIHYVYSLNNSNYSETLLLSDDFTVSQNKVLKVGEKDTYKIRMWLSLDADEEFMNKTFKASISLIATQNEYKYATNVIEKLAQNNLDSLVNDNNNYRYNSNESPNYIWFNCEDGYTKGDDYCEKWRIIGSFMNISQNKRNSYHMLKIISNKIVDDIPFNNPERVGEYNDSYIETFANGAYYDKLSDSAKSYITKAKWNIGSTTSTDYVKAIIDENNEVYYGNIGLLNVSDYLFIKNNSFIPKDIMFIDKYDNNSVNILNEDIVKGESTNNYGFLPCIYLRPDISILSGDGSVNNPYEITIKYPMNY